MRRNFIQIAVLFLTGMAIAVLPPTTCAQGKPERLGQLTVDKYEATVNFQDCLKEQKLLRLTLTLRKPRKDPGIDGGRFQVWLLENDGRCVGFVHYPLRIWAEEGDGEQVTAKVVYCFNNNVSRHSLTAVVVAVDGEPTAFKIPTRDTAGVDAKVIAAWEKAGAYFILNANETKVPCFYFERLRWPVAQPLPLPEVPFGLLTAANGSGSLFLNKLPGYTQARLLRLERMSLTEADRKELATLQQLRTLILTNSRHIGDADLKAVARLPRLQTLSLSNTQISDVGLKELRSLNLSRTNLNDVGMKHLAGLKELRLLYLAGSISDAGLVELTSLKHLQRLFFNTTFPNVTGEGIETLRKALPAVCVTP